MTPNQAIRARAEAMLKPGDELQVCTDATSVPGSILVGIARPTHAAVLTIDAAEYERQGGAVALAQVLGFDLRQPTAMERVLSVTKPARRA